MYKVDVGKKILSENEVCALKNKKLLAEWGILCLNMISAPGSGKTTILARTINELKEKNKIGVIEGDVQTDLDAEKIRATGAAAVQIETRGACHLSAAQVNAALKKLPVAELDVIFIENVGNLICPSAFELGEAGKIAVLSVAEGDDKPAKYPAIFAKSMALVINKIDLQEAVGQVDFDIERVKADCRKLNQNIKIFPVSAKTGAGFGPWCEWLKSEVNNLTAGN
jgi:hydrogenase nickel incorporation protein HypB